MDAADHWNRIVGILHKPTHQAQVLLEILEVIDSPPLDIRNGIRAVGHCRHRTVCTRVAIQRSVPMILDDGPRGD